jgi:hypothetical protein
MKNLNDIVSELQAVDTTALDSVVAAIAQAVTDLQAVIAATPATPAADPIATVVVTTAGGVVTTCVPQA